MPDHSHHSSHPGSGESLTHGDSPHPEPLERRSLWSRRKWLKWTVPAIGLGCFADAYFVEPQWVEFIHRDLPIENLPTDWDGRTLVQLSDIHVGRSVSESYLTQTFDRVAALQPDIVVVTGDFVTSYGRTPPPREQIERVYSHLPRGAIATLGCLGNHDHGNYRGGGKLSAQLTEILLDHGLRMLVNGATDLGGLQIAGVDDLWRGDCRIRETLRQTSPDAARLVLCHNPDGADLAGWDGYRGWILSGHTHGGQCKPPFLPPPLLPVKNQRYTAGEFAVADGRQLYISRGLGHLLPVRFNCRPEVTVFRMVSL